MSKLKKRVVEYYMFYCPGCKCEHTYPISSDDSNWWFNGNMDKPSFTPSLKNSRPLYDDNGNIIGEYICHLFVTDGEIEYYSDCTHELSGKIIEL